MSDIKFRAWDTLRKVMVAEGFHVLGEVTMFGEIDNYCLSFHEGKSSLERYGDIKIMRYTGLKDKNKKEIYEGDILKAFSPSVPCYEVFYDRYGFRLRYKLKSGDFYDWGPLYRLEEIWNEERQLKIHPEIIGNVYENPDLIPQST